MFTVKDVDHPSKYFHQIFEVNIHQNFPPSKFSPFKILCYTVYQISNFTICHYMIKTCCKDGLQTLGENIFALINIHKFVYSAHFQGRSHDFLGGQVYFAPSRSYLYFTLRKELLKCSSSYKMHNLFQFCTNNTCKQSMSQLGGLVACHHRKF